MEGGDRRSTAARNSSSAGEDDPMGLCSASEASVQRFSPHAGLDRDALAILVLAR
jgi:hypothetical protein